MLYNALADLVVALHAAFVLFAVAGALLVWRRPAWAWVHVPAAAWAALVELAGSTCPLTPLENWLRRRGGAAGYESGFVEHYLLPVLYPPALTREVQVVLGALVLVFNAALYAWIWGRRRSKSA